ncbi:MAG: DUF2071 domain-containing protein [Fimbriimonadales bacterium]
MTERNWRPALSMRWKHLLFVHWQVPVQALRPLIPPPLEVDTYNGSAWVGFVPFVMESVRPVWLPPIPKLLDFPEANVRTYVRLGAQRGVWFFSLDAQHRLGVWVARRHWNLPYHYARMYWRQTSSTEFEYTVERRNTQTSKGYAQVRYQIEGTPAETVPGSLEHFLVERYTLFTGTSRKLYRAEVAHLPYEIQPVTLLHLEQNLVECAGIRTPDSAPVAFYAPGFGVLASGLRTAVQSDHSGGTARLRY